jgi:hypothetical protein
MVPLPLLVTLVLQERGMGLLDLGEPATRRNRKILKVMTVSVVTRVVGNRLIYVYQPFPCR